MAAVASPALLAAKKSELAAMARQTAQLQDEALYKYVQGNTIYDRFSGIAPPGGIRMLQSVKQHYGVEGQTDIKLPWFQPDGSPTFEPHEDNIREHESVVQEYADSIREQGRGHCNKGPARPSARSSRAWPRPPGLHTA